MKNKTYFVFSDVHSFYKELMKALKDNGFDKDNPDHILISCGDFFDRGPDSKKLLNFITIMLKQNRIICIKGNHEELMEDVFEKQEFGRHDIHNGTVKTFEQLGDTSLADPELINDVKTNKKLNNYLNSCLDYYELGNNIFVHGWIPVHISIGMYVDKVFPIEDWRNGNWSKARWINGMEMWNEGIRLEGKTIYCGHWNSSWGHANLHNDGVERLNRIETMYIDPETGKMEPHVNNDPFKDEGIVALDACTVLSHRVNVEVIEI